MKTRLFTLFLLSLFWSTTVVAQKNTTIYVVRHAEKDLTDPANKNPPLTQAGRQRAEALATLLQKKKIAAVFSTPYLRNQETAAPLANQIGKDAISYDPKNNDLLVAQILKEFNHRSVVIIGHSNTVLDIVRAFGGNPPIQEIPDDQYNLLFKLTLKPQGTQTRMLTYGN